MNRSIYMYSVLMGGGVGGAIFNVGAFLTIKSVLHKAFNVFKFD